MNVLVIDTSTESIALGLRINGRVYSADAHLGQKHAEYLLPSLNALFTRAQVSWAELNGIALGLGPGMFTALRIGCAMAQMFAYSARLPLLSVNSLEALAASTPNRPNKVLACFDARMGEIYAAAYDFEAQQTLIPPCVIPPENLPALSASDWIGVGSGFLAHADTLQQTHSQLSELHPHLAPHTHGLLRLVDNGHYAVTHWPGCPPEQVHYWLTHSRDGERSPDTLQPLYLRDKVALKINERPRP